MSRCWDKQFVDQGSGDFSPRASTMSDLPGRTEVRVCTQITVAFRFANGHLFAEQSTTVRASHCRATPYVPRRPGSGLVGAAGRFLFFFLTCGVIRGSRGIGDHLEFHADLVKNSVWQFDFPVVDLSWFGRFIVARGRQVADDVRGPIRK